MRRWGFSISRIWAIMLKEFILMKHDPSVIAIMAILPVILICIAGYAVNTYPKKVPTALINLDSSDVTRELIQGMENTGYFSFVASTADKSQAYEWLKASKVMFILTIPPDFTKKWLRKENPSLILEDGSLDSLSTGRATAALAGLRQAFLEKQLNSLTPASSFQIIIHRLYNPDNDTQYYVVPGMLGLVLMLTMLMITTVIAFRDVEGGTINYLLSSPTQSAEILLGEILSYIIVGFLQLSLGLVVAHYLFHVPFVGNVGLLYLCAFPYIVAELSLGLTIATFCRTRFEAVQMLNIFIALSVILTGFNFPIFSMPLWAQYIGQFLPLTHFFKILFGIMLKGNELPELWQNLWPLLVYCIIMISIATIRFRKHSIGEG